MATLPISPAPCNADAEKSFSRLLRLAGTFLLTIQSLVLIIAALMAFMGPEQHVHLGDILFLAATLSLLGCALWSYRNPAAASRWLTIACPACFIALFITGYAHNADGMTITSSTATRYYNPALTLAGLILTSMVLSRFIRWSATKAACNCG